MARKSKGSTLLSSLKICDFKGLTFLKKILKSEIRKEQKMDVNSLPSKYACFLVVKNVSFDCQKRQRFVRIAFDENLQLGLVQLYPIVLNH
jgi:hypothetical protein